MVPTAKERKYDRQLRLWASSGQEALENAHICLIGATATGSELVKNLVLPGIGKLTVCDDNKVGEADLGNNFFVTEEDLGTSRAASVEKLVKELNPEVETFSVGKSAEELLNSGGDEFWNQFSLVIACGVHQPVLEKINELLFDRNVALMVVDSVGFYGSIRVSVKQHDIVELHPESLVDLRLTSPWEELREFAASFDLASLDESDLAHVPYVVLLLIYLERYKQQNNKELPQNFAQKKQLRSMIQTDANKMQDGQNFEEAAGAVLRTVQPNTIPSSIQELCGQAEQQYLKTGEAFWGLVAALKLYIDAYGTLPQPGVLPDMKADTKTFVALQMIYRGRAKQDVDEMERLVKQAAPELVVSRESVETFCKNARYIRAVHGSKLADGKLPSSKLEDDTELINNYLALQAYKQCVLETGKIPGEQDQDDDLVPFALKLTGSVSSGAQTAMREVVRAGGAELHNIAAFLGGVGGQEAIKLLTHQYGALDNLVVYDGIKASTAVYTL